MNLSFLKWPAIIGAVVLVGWLASSGGVNHMYKKYASAVAGADAKADEKNEAGLSRIGSYSLILFKYKQALEIFDFTVQKYPNGKNVWYNIYLMVKCAEKVEDPMKAKTLLDTLISADAHALDDRVPVTDTLRLRKEKLVEMYDLEKR
jgi:hypothetical protein